MHGFCKANVKMRSLKIQEKWSICEIIGENESFRKVQSDKLGYLSSQPRCDRFDTSAYKQKSRGYFNRETYCNTIDGFLQQFFEK